MHAISECGRDGGVGVHVGLNWMDDKYTMYRGIVLYNRIIVMKEVKFSDTPGWSSF